MGRNRFVQVLDLCTLATSYVAVAIYVIKMLSVTDVMEVWRKSPKVCHVSVPVK